MEAAVGLVVRRSTGRRTRRARYCPASGLGAPPVAGILSRTIWREGTRGASYARKAAVKEDPDNEPTGALEVQRTILEYERKVRTLQSRLETLERENERFTAVVNAGDGGLLVFNSALKVEWASDVFKQKFGHGTDTPQVVGAPCNKVMCRREKICDRCPALAPFTSGLVAHHEFLTEIDGRSRHIYASGMPITSASGDIDQT